MLGEPSVLRWEGRWEPLRALSSGTPSIEVKKEHFPKLVGSSFKAVNRVGNIQSFAVTLIAQDNKITIANELSDSFFDQVKFTILHYESNLKD